MKCLVCQITWPEASSATCPQCGFDHGGADARNPVALERARAAFRDKTSAFAPDSRVSRRDRIQPWLAVLLGFVLFVVWLRACSSGGFQVW